MVLTCWHYNYKVNGKTSSTCSGSFETCATLKECKSESHKVSACFALARLNIQNDGTNNAVTSNSPPGTNINKVTRVSGNETTMLAAGCLSEVQQDDDESCDTECLGKERSYGHYYCCCNLAECNKMLTPKYIPMSAPHKAVDRNDTLPPFPPSSLRPEPSSTIFTMPVILIVVLTALTTIILATYFRRIRLKRNNGGLNRRSNHRNSNDNSALGNHHNRHELQDMRTNVDALVPFRTSFGDENNHHFHYGQHDVTHRNDNKNFTNYASRITPNDAMNNNNNISNHEQIDLKRVKLLDIVGSGRFGTVHKAILAMHHDEQAPSTSATVAIAPIESGSPQDGKSDGKAREPGSPSTSEIAVKIIPNNEFQSFQNELRIYSSPRTRHPNILTFLGFTESPATSSHWLLVEYASNGSLHHYLNKNTVSWPDFLSISLGIVRGLSHLHDADIAHRDFKSKNVLLRHNLSPCITDFGVASMLDASSSRSQHEQRKKYLQVGTPRYMAPEVLECSVAFTKISFTKIDVYALSLVLWELLSRCYPLPKPRNNDYDDTMMCMTYTRNQEDRQHIPAPYYHQAPPPPYFHADSGHPAPVTPPPPPLAITPPGHLANSDHFESQSKILHAPLYPNEDGDGEARAELLKQMQSSPRQAPLTINGSGGSGEGHDVADGAPGTPANTSALSANGLEISIDLSDIMPPSQFQPPVYKMPFEAAVGQNPDINTMRQAVVTEKLRPPIRPEWRFYPVSKLCQAIVDGWEYDHDARISASCFVERIEALQQQVRQQQQQQSGEQVIEMGRPRTPQGDDHRPNGHEQRSPAAQQQQQQHPESPLLPPPRLPDAATVPAAIKT